MNKYICFESIKIKCAIFLEEGFPFDSHEHFPLPFSITLYYPSRDCILLCGCRMTQLTPGFLWGRNSVLTELAVGSAIPVISANLCFREEGI